MSANAPQPGGGGDVIQPSQPPKDPILICILNLLIFGGLGYIIMGQKTKGIVAIAACILAALPTCGIGGLVVALVGAIDGYLQAQALQQGHPIGQWTWFQQHR